MIHILFAIGWELKDPLSLAVEHRDAYHVFFMIIYFNIKLFQGDIYVRLKIVVKIVMPCRPLRGRGWMYLPYPKNLTWR